MRPAGDNNGHLPNTSNSPLGPEEITRLSRAYEQALRTIGVQDRNDPLTELTAKKIIEIGQTGLKDPAAICGRAVEELGLPKGRFRGRGGCTQATDPTAVRATAIAAKVRPRVARRRPLFPAELPDHPDDLLRMEGLLHDAAAGDGAWCCGREARRVDDRQFRILLSAAFRDLPTHRPVRAARRDQHGRDVALAPGQCVLPGARVDHVVACLAQRFDDEFAGSEGVLDEKYAHLCLISDSICYPCRTTRMSSRS